ncbi:hypothetical protein BJ875DRAFT_448845 [Amylocarpus encephaloides]|uniref:Chromo domain-containing protein n=1 Tax=Amylocarpus encephaloides TaxID=45428 RepID=A0A9P7YT48_9HELO|nr:hypothetical protein BJ875DRAFT_448845 [Amylocarpus encephaloides]
MATGHVQDQDGYVYRGVADGSPTVLFGSLLNTLERFEKEDEEARAREDPSPNSMPRQSLPHVSSVYLPSTILTRLENRSLQTMPGNKVFEPQSTKRRSSDMSDVSENDSQDWSAPQKRSKLPLRGGRGSSSLESSSKSASESESVAPEDIDAALQTQLNIETATALKTPTFKGRVDKPAVNYESDEANQSEDPQQVEEEQSEENESIGENDQPRKKRKKNKHVIIKNVLASSINDESGDENQSSSASYVVERFRADRQTPIGPEILVEWQDYPEKADWTWESEERLVERVPEMVATWHMREPEEENEDNENAENIIVMEVDKIIGRRKRKDTFWYKVSWKGYPSKDCTWEPYETLHTDVPFIVEAYDRKQQKTSKRKR